MKKIVIPTILAATILVAGMFAMMPVQKASTVHSAIGVLNKASGVADATGATFANIVAPSAVVKSGNVRALAFTDVIGTADALAISVCNDAACATTTVIIAEAAPNTEAHWTGFGLQLTGSTAADADTVGFIVTWT